MIFNGDSLAHRYSNFMKNPNLVPKQITDKNGVTSIRWIRPDQAAMLNGISIPAPAVAETIGHADQKTVKAAALLYVKQVTYDEDDDEYVEDCLETAIEVFSSYPSSVVDDILKESSNTYGKMWGLKDLMDVNARVEDLRDYLNLFNYFIDNNLDGDVDPRTTIFGVASSYEGLDPVSVTGGYPEKREKQLKGLLGGTVRISELINEGLADEGLLTEFNEYDVPVITDERLSGLFINRPEYYETIFRFMDERKTADYDRITEHLNSATPAIASGAL